jgi:hypothetical protein
MVDGSGTVYNETLSNSPWLAAADKSITRVSPSPAGEEPVVKLRVQVSQDPTAGVEPEADPRLVSPAEGLPPVVVPA